MIFDAIILGPGGIAVFGKVELPTALLKGEGVFEQRLPGDFGPWHTAADGTATILVVAAGEWEVKVPGETRTFKAGSIVVAQDGGATNENGHCSKAGGTETLVLSKTTVPIVFKVV